MVTNREPRLSGDVGSKVRGKVDSVLDRIAHSNLMIFGPLENVASGRSILAPPGTKGENIVGKTKIIGLLCYMIEDFISSYVPGVKSDATIVGAEKTKDSVVYTIRVNGSLKTVSQQRAIIEVMPTLTGIFTKPYEVLSVEKISQTPLRDSWMVKIKIPSN